ncbi:MAG: hypothetical protein ACYC9M_04710 [Desulfobulbaceae bacterium]
MNTDEYQISLAREITVCNNIIAKITRELARLEKKHSMTSAEFARTAQAENGVDTAECSHWLQEYETLRTWQQRLQEYEEALSATRLW